MLILAPDGLIDRIQHLTMDLEIIRLKFSITERHIFSRKGSHTRKKLEKAGQDEMYSSWGFNYNYREFVGYEIRDRLI